MRAFCDVVWLHISCTFALAWIMWVLPCMKLLCSSVKPWVMQARGSLQNNVVTYVSGTFPSEAPRLHDYRASVYLEGSEGQDSRFEALWGVHTKSVCKKCGQYPNADPNTANPILLFWPSKGPIRFQI